MQCTALKTLILPKGLESIGQSVFNGCKSLTSAAIPESVTSIGWGAFRECDSLYSVTFGDKELTQRVARAILHRGEGRQGVVQEG